MIMGNILSIKNLVLNTDRIIGFERVGVDEINLIIDTGNKFTTALSFWDSSVLDNPSPEKTEEVYKCVEERLKRELGLED
jgi:hypothetical protein